MTLTPKKTLLALALALTGLAYELPDAAAAEPAAAEPAAAEPAAAEPAAAEPATRASDTYFPRFRWGMSVVGGPLLGDVSGAVGGANARFGAQINDLIGVYGQPVGLVGAGVNASISNASATGLALAGVGGLVDFTLGDIFYVGAGPEVLVGGVAETSTTTASASAGAFFSVAGRAGFVFGPKTPMKRAGFQLGLDLHVIFAPSATVVVPMLALGFESF